VQYLNRLSGDFPIFENTVGLRRNILILLLFPLFARSQDMHFSQFDGSLLNISPAFTGLFNGDFRLSSIYRGQWHTVPVSYSTFNLNGEAKIRPRLLIRDFIGAGFTFNSDRAGDANYGTTQFYLSGAYIFRFRGDSTFMLSLGASAGWCQLGFDYSKMTFDNQYDGLKYNPGLAAGEAFGWTQQNFMDFNGGAALSYAFRNRHRLQYGVGVYHIGSPVVSYQGNDISRLEYKMSHYASYTLPANEKSDVIFEALYSLQGKYYELVPNFMWKRYIERKENQAVLAGVSWRARDAIILRLGYHHRTLQSGLAYDINISRFTAATNRFGAIELFVNYVFRIHPSFVAKKRHCPFAL
jgi:type IX secretion system PorP/SprF family membrane protein